MSNDNLIKPEAQVVADLAQKAAAETREVMRVEGGTPFLVFPSAEGGYEVMDLEDKLPNPSQITEELIFTDIPSFCAYVNEFKDHGTKVFGVAELNDVRFVARLDYHIASTGVSGLIPRWNRHSATYNFPQTPEWQEILGKNKKMLSQLEFAHMVERLRVNFKEPSGGVMIDIARTLEARTEGEFKSSIRLENGDRELVYKQATSATAGAPGDARIPIPGQLELWVQPFVRGPHFSILALFRYKVSSGQVTFEYELVKPHEFIDFAVQATAKEITDKTSLVPLFGKF